MENTFANGMNANLFAERAREARGRLSQKEFGEKCGLTAQAISKYENAGSSDGRLPSIANAVAMARAAGVSLDWLAGLSDQKQAQPAAQPNLRLENYWDAYSALEQISSRLQGCLSVAEVEDCYSYPIKAEKVFRLQIKDEKLVQLQEMVQSIEELETNNLKVSGNFNIGKMARTGLQSEMEKQPLPSDIFADDIPF